MPSPTSLQGRNLPAAMFLVLGPLQDDERVGTLMACVGRAFASANADIAFAHLLGRVPNGYIAYRSSTGGVLYDASTGTAAWTATSITLRATLTGTYSFLLL
ncbi:MAG: hypothetical protein WCD38_11835 [Candidatus Tumulicola sp.]